MADLRGAGGHDRGPELWAWLARRRVTLGFAFGALVLWLAAPTSTTLMIGTPIASAGELMRIWAAGHLYKAREVTSSGPYRWFAHPLYVGSTVIGIGLAVASASPAVFALVAIYLGATLTAAVQSEEAFLRRTFGARYDRYRRGAQETLETLETLETESGEPAAGDARRRFSLAQAWANREYRAVVGLLLAVLLLVLKATYNGVFWRTAGT